MEPRAVQSRTPVACSTPVASALCARSRERLGRCTSCATLSAVTRRRPRFFSRRSLHSTPLAEHCTHLPVGSILHMRRFFAHILHDLHKRVVVEESPSSPTVGTLASIATILPMAAGSPILVGAAPTMDGWPDIA